MFAEHYGYSGPPFALTPDARFFFGSRGHSRAIAHLVYGLSQSEGFIVITGEVGAGKTTLVEQLCAQLNRANYLVGRIVTTRVGGDDLLKLALAAFGEREEATTKAALLRRFEDLLREQRSIGRRVLLIVDEVQNLSFAALEELRMLSNITITDPRTGARLSVQTILLGQPQFRRMLSSPDLDQLRQRVLASFHLGPLDASETRAYVEHRLTMVGWTAGNPAFAAAAFDEIHRQTGGIPRRINTLCSRVLLLCALEEATEVTAEMVVQTAAEQSRDLGAGGSAGPTAAVGDEMAGGGAYVTSPDVATADLGARLARLEAAVLRQDRVVRRLLDVIAGLHRAAPGAIDQVGIGDHGDPDGEEPPRPFANVVALRAQNEAQDPWA